MPVTSVTTDAESLTLTLVADFSAPVERLRSAFTQPAQLERFWGPPGWPAKFSAFDFTPGGLAHYTMTGPHGETSSGRWEFLRIDADGGFEVLDAFVGEDGQPAAEMPVSRMKIEFTSTDEGSRLTSVTHFPSLDALEQLTAMGMVEGITMATNQLDAVLQDLRDYAQGKGTVVEILDEQHVKITRLIAGPRSVVWRAHTDPDLMKKWLLGPDGWTMPVAEIAAEVGQSYRSVWEPAPGTEGEPFGFEGELLLIEPESRIVQTERMIGVEGVETLNDLTFYEEDGATLLTLFIEYPDAATRDMILATGMADGMEASYARLESLVLT